MAAGAVAAGGVGVSLRRAAQTLQERQAPLAGLVAAYIFAVQMLNFPVAAGTSGHLLGGVLAAVLVGPWAGCICVAVVLVVQSLFADGGLTALGLNITNMAIVGVFVFLLPVFAGLAGPRAMDFGPLPLPRALAPTIRARAFGMQAIAYDVYWDEKFAAANNVKRAALRGCRAAPPPARPPALRRRRRRRGRSGRCGARP